MQAASGRPGHPWILEIFICIVIYMAGSIAVGIGQVPGMMAYMLQNKEYIHVLRTGEVDMELVMKLVQNMPEWFTIFMLFTEIFLILVYMLYCRFIEKRKISTMGFAGEGAVSQYVKGLLIGAAAFVSTYLLCLVTGSIGFGGVARDVIPAYILLYFCGYMIQGMAEEVICRGFLMVSLSRRYSVWFSAVVSSLFFMSMHFLNEGITWIAMVNLFLFGMFMALLFAESGNIWVVGAVHTVWNFLQGNVFGVQVSGLAKQNSVFVTSFKDGWSVIHGGSFGMEGGLAVTVVLVVGIVMIYNRMANKDMLADVPAGRESEGTAAGQWTQGGFENEGDSRVYRNDPSVFTETPWRPTTEQRAEEHAFPEKAAEKKTGETSFGEVFASQDKGPVKTVFDAEYFRGEDHRLEIPSRSGENTDLE